LLARFFSLTAASDSAYEIIHLPILEDLSDRYNICALCDVSPNLLGLIGERYGVDRLYTNAGDLIKQESLDAIFVLNSD
jgi:predicted dehydrogenase